MDTLIAVAASAGTTICLMAALFMLRRRLRIVRALSFILFLASVAAGLGVYKAFGLHHFPQFESFFTWFLVTLGVISLLRVISLYVFDVHLRARRGVQLPAMVPLVILAVAYLVVGVIVLRLVYPDLNLGPLLATSAVTSLVLGLALQPILGNLFAGLVISLEQPYRINDWIKVGDTEGRVVEITWRTTHLRTRDNDNLIIPNGKAADVFVLNYYYPNQMHLARIYVGAHYNAPPYRVRRAMLACVPGVDGVLEKPSPDVYVRDFDASAISYELRVWIKDVADIDRIKSELRMRIWDAFKREGITIPFPIRTLEFAPRAKVRAEGVRAPSARLFIADGAGAGATLRLSAQPVTIGRTPACDIQLADQQVSKEHARIEWTDDGFVLSDLQSSHGTLVNGVRIERCVLKPLDRLVVGGTVLVMEDDGA